jgi:hypothetical protein
MKIIKHTRSSNGYHWECQNIFWPIFKQILKLMFKLSLWIQFRFNTEYRYKAQISCNFVKILTKFQVQVLHDIVQLQKYHRVMASIPFTITEILKRAMQILSCWNSEQINQTFMDYKSVLIKAKFKTDWTFSLEPLTRLSQSMQPLSQV